MPKPIAITIDKPTSDPVTKVIPIDHWSGAFFGSFEVDSGTPTFTVSYTLDPMSRTDPDPANNLNWSALETDLTSTTDIGFGMPITGINVDITGAATGTVKVKKNPPTGPKSGGNNGGRGTGKTNSPQHSTGSTPGLLILDMEGSTSDTINGRTVNESNTTYPTSLTGVDAKWGTTGVSGSSTTDTQFVDGLSVDPLSDGDFQYAGDFTFEFWYRYDNGPAHGVLQPDWTITGGVVDQTVDADNRGYVLYFAVTGTINCRLVGNDGQYYTGHQLLSPSLPSFQDYSHVVLQREGTTVKLGAGGNWSAAANTGSFPGWLDTFGLSGLGVKVGYGKTINNIASLVDFESFKPGQPFAQCIDGLRMAPSATYDMSGSTYTVPTEFWTS